jgi:hypothetical protein
MIRDALPGRSDASIKNRFALISRRGWIHPDLTDAKPCLPKEEIPQSTIGEPSAFEDLMSWERPLDDAARLFQWEW